MKSLVKLDIPGGKEYFLQTEYKDDGMSGFRLMLVHGLAAWQGLVTEKDLDKLRLNIKMDLETFIKQTLQALTKSGDGDISFTYQLKRESDDSVELIWKKHIPTEDITFQLGKAILNVCSTPAESISSILNFCIDCTKSQQTEITALQTDNDRLSKERVNALKRLEKCVIAKEELERDLYSKFAAILNSKKEKIRELKHSTENSTNDVDDSKPGPSRTITQSQKRPAKGVNYSDEEHTTDDEGGTQQRKKAKKGENKTLDDDSLVLEEENEDKPTIVARPKRNREPNKKTTNAKPVLPKISSKDSNTSISERPSSSRKSRASSGNTCDTDPNAMIDDL